MSERDEIEMIKRRVAQLVNEVEDFRQSFEKSKSLFQETFENLKKELESEVRGEWSWKKKGEPCE